MDHFELPLAKLEAKEAIAVLSGNGAWDLTELCLRLGQKCWFWEHSSDYQAAYDTLLEKLQTKAGLEKLRELIANQGGNPDVIDNPSLLPAADYQTVVTSSQSGFIKSIDALKLGSLVMQLGAGRIDKASSIDYSVGIELKVKRNPVGINRPLTVVPAANH